MRNLLERLEIERAEYIREHREAPTVHLTKTKGDRITGRLTDVGTDFIELSGFYTNSPVVKISRAQIAEIEIHRPKGRANA